MQWAISTDILHVMQWAISTALRYSTCHAVGYFNCPQINREDLYLRRTNLNAAIMNEVPNYIIIAYFHPHYPFIWQIRHFKTLLNLPKI